MLPKLARLDSSIVDELRRLVISKGITISDGSESAVGFAVDRDFVKMNITNENRLNHKEYKYLRNYFDLENLKYLKDRDENVPYSLTLQHRDISLEGFSLQLSNHELLDYLNKHEYRDEITWVLTYRFQGKSGLIKINYTQMKLIYEELELLPDLPIDTELKGKLRTGIKNRYCISEREKSTYHNIRDYSVNALKKFIVQDVWYNRSKEAYLEYELDS